MKKSINTLLPYVEGIRHKFAHHRNDFNAGPMKKYMRDQFEFFGIKSVLRRELSKEYIKFVGLPPANELEKTVLQLWDQPERELQYFAMELLAASKKMWVATDMKWIEKLVIAKSWWDTVDFLASNVAGPWFKKFPGKKEKISARWNASENMWLQRMSILFQLKYKSETDRKILRNYILPLMESKEFFIRKAIGWALREYAKTDPKFVIKQVKELPLSPLSKKEAMKGIERIRMREEVQ